MTLTDSVTSLPGIGSIMANKLAKLEIKSVFDLLYHIPFRYEDRRLISLARQVQVGESVTVVGTISAVKNVFTKNGKRMQSATIADASGTLAVIWFNQLYLARVFTPDSTVALFGKADFFNKKPALISPDYELLTNNYEPIHTCRLVPVYPETAGLSSKWLRGKIYQLLRNLEMDDFLPSVQGLTLYDWKTALKCVHFPDQLEQVEPARHRLAFDELLLLQLAALVHRNQWRSQQLTHALAVDQEKILQFLAQLPFSLTVSQNQAIKEILGDLSRPIPMNRLLEGDVGSGKTVVAAVAAYVAHLNGWQTLLMAPTQILAAQHHNTLSVLFKPFGIEIGLITSQSKFKIKNLKLKILVGTHALLSAKLQMDHVGLIVIDEQHRFGVAQRALITAKASSPHILTMTATPIPRTIALTMYGDLDLSTLTDMPVGRIPVKTWAVPETKRQAAYEWIKSQKSQCFIVCPFINDSETLTTIKAATSEFNKLKKIFIGLKLGLLHGKLKATEKDDVINKFRAGEYQILVTTPVVEVGIDISTATIIVIEGADRFGLAQLHQLRGRVGRGQQQSYCLLFANEITPRLKAMERYHSGIELAEIDLRLRGPGEIYGLAQHGQTHFKVATYTDLDLIAQAKTTATALLPRLDKLPVLRSLVEKDKIGLVTPN